MRGALLEPNRIFERDGCFVPSTRAQMIESVLVTFHAEVSSRCIHRIGEKRDFGPGKRLFPQRFEAFDDLLFSSSADQFVKRCGR